MTASTYCSYLIVLLFLALYPSIAWCEVCPPENATCYYTFIVQPRLSLYAAMFDNTCGPPGCFAQKFTNGSFSGILGKNDLPMEHPETIITADGVHPGRLLTVVGPEEDKQMLPGPSIEVYEGQEIVVDVINGMQAEGVTIHWHGLHMRESPWMDGVQDLTQCPIPPGVTMTYQFKADPGGTHWYHSHSGMQRNNGLFGPLVIRPKPSEEKEEEQDIIDRIILTINDYDPNHSAEETFWYMMASQTSLLPNLDRNFVRDEAGDLLEPFQTNLSFLINGRGRHFDTEEEDFNGAPLHIVEAGEGETHRVRVINAGMTFPFRLSIDNHSLVVVASDGNELEPVEVESIIMWPGERYDFLVKLDQPPDAYWIRATSLVIGKYEQFVKPMGLAVLKYQGSSSDEPATAAKDFERPCSADARCKVANCPFPRFSEVRYSDCLLFGKELVAAEGVPSAPAERTDPNSEPTFLNFAFPGVNSSDASVNGQSIKLPGFPILVSPEKREWLTTCNEKCGANETCHCPIVVSPSQDEVIDMVFTNIGSGAGWSHPVHLHGYSFFVLKSGFVDHLGEYVTNSGPQKDESDPILNPDIQCSLAGSVLANVTWDHRPMCNSMSWARAGGPVEPNFARAPLKDTIMVPGGGYVWVRLKADNPGIWFMHCHLSLHVEDGMAVVLASGMEVLDELKPIPPEFLNCKNLIS